MRPAKGVVVEQVDGVVFQILLIGPLLPNIDDILEADAEKPGHAAIIDFGEGDAATAASAHSAVELPQGLGAGWVGADPDSFCRAAHQPEKIVDILFTSPANRYLFPPGLPNLVAGGLVHRRFN